MNSPKVGMVSLGCPKALVDSERILTQLRQDGYEIVGDYDGADLVIVNTCGFIDHAKAESLEAIGEALDANGRVLVTGCLGAQPEEIQRIHPKVLGITGPQQYDAVVSAVHQHLQPPEHNPFVDLVPPQGLKLTPQHYAYLKIAEGCNHQCRFCIIPSMRGKLVSRPLGLVMREAEQLAAAGVKELLVISQDTSAYGVDTRYQTDWWNQREWRTDLLNLSQALGELGIWVRLHYVYPYPHVDQIIPLMAEGRILPYLDIPFQHGSPRILKLMRRPAATENTLERIQRWREICPDLTLRSTFIVGFPGETETDFEELLDFLEAAQLDRVGCFQYSPVDGAAANQLPDPVDDDEKQDRWERFMDVQERISQQRLQRWVGREIQVLVDGEDEDGRLVGRSQADAPEIDGVVYLQQDDPTAPYVQAGDWCRVRVSSSETHDLHGVIIAQ
ncbi:MAG: 30S ribosomal protein S12 methylthiotransferase RimO [Wenzhouxiangellaceae bacterium]